MSQIKASDTKPSVVLIPFVQELLSFCSTRPENQWKRATGKTLKQLAGDATNVYVPFLTDFVAANQIWQLKEVDLLLLRTTSL